MKKIIISCICFVPGIFIFSPYLVAQNYNNYNISRYITPEISRKQLDINFNGFANFLNEKQDSLYSSNDQSAGELSSTLLTYKNTRHVFSLFQLNGSFNASSNKTKFDQPATSSNSFKTEDNLLLNYKACYYNPNKLFMTIKVGGEIDYDYKKSNSKLTLNDLSILQRESSLNNLTTSLNPGFGFGFGRLESVEDARQAIYILDELDKKGVLSRVLSDEEITQLSHKISTIKNKRIFDSRLRKIEEISTIDTFFTDKKLLNKSDAAYFTTLYDMWEYGSQFSRKSGQVFEITFNPELGYQTEKLNPVETNNLEDYKNTTYGGNVNFGYSFEKPVKLNWQHSIAANMNLYSKTNDLNKTYLSSTNIQKINEAGAFLYGRYTLNFYPNTRTSFGGSITQYLRHSNQKQTINSIPSDDTKVFFSGSGVNLSANYYFSPQLRLSGNTGIGVSYLNISDSGRWNVNKGLSVALTYSFF